MRQEFKEKLNNRSLGIWVDVEASGLDADETDATEYDSVEYLIHDDAVWSWDDEKVLSLDEIDDEEWDNYIEEEGSSYFECFIQELLCYVIEDRDLPGHDEVNNFFDEKLKLLVLLKDEDDNIEEELDEVFLPDFV
jgi:hypothetical protein